jgi:signal transduction histidine kinase
MDAQENISLDFFNITAIVLGVILVYFIISLIRHQRRNIKLNQEKVEAEIITLENERRRMAADLHDEIGPTLSGIKLMLSGISVHAEEELELLSRINGHIDNTIQRMREISNNLMPRVLEKRGIDEALRQLFDEQTKIHGLKIDFKHTDGLELNAEQKLHLYRIMQEILHNTLKHAKARTLKVDLAKDGRLIVLQTHDDGIGFRFSGELKKASGLGLRNLMSRSEILHGNIDIESTPNKGTKLILKFPL